MSIRFDKIKGLFFLFFSLYILYLLFNINIYNYSLIPMIFLTILFLFIFLKEYNGNLLEPILYVLFQIFLIYLIIPSIVIKEDLFYHPHQINQEKVSVLVFLYVSICTIFLYIGYKSHYYNLFLKNLKSKRFDWDYKKVKLIIVIYFLFGLLCFFILIYLNGGFRTYLYYLYNRSRLIQGKGFVKEGINAALISFIALLILYSKKKLFTFEKYLLIFLFLLTLLLFTFLGSRGVIIYIIVSTLFFYNYNHKIISFKNLILYLITFLILLNALGTLRDRAAGYEKFNSEDIMSSFKERFTVLISRDLNWFDTTLAVFENYKSFDEFKYGRSYIDSLLALIPRALYREKPFGLAEEINYKIYGVRFYHTEDISSPQSASSITWLDELYINFHFLGALIGGFLFGLIIRIMREYFMTNKNNKNATLVFIVLAPYIFTLSGDMFQNIVHIFSIVSLLFIFNYFATNKTLLKRF